MSHDPTAPQLDRLTWFDRSDRTRLEITGPDRAKFLHNLTTNDVKRLAEGAGHEAFVTSPQGKTLAYITNLATDRAILLRSDPGVLGSFLPHLTKYGVFDDVAITDVSAETFEYHLIGPAADGFVQTMGCDSASLTKPLAHREVKLGDQPIRIVRESLLGEPGWTLIGPVAGGGSIEGRLRTMGSEGDAATMEALRIEAGTPASGRDVETNNLPQEVGRDNLAINFVKGCYLGQETVARLDALGHVNRILRGGWIEGSAEVPPAGTPLVGPDGKAVGAITSAAFSPMRQTSVWLGYVRVTHAVAGTRLAVPSLGGHDGSLVEAVVIELPVPAIR